MTVGELGARMDSGELTEWMAHFRLNQVQEKEEEVRTFADPEEHSAALDGLFASAPKVKA